MRFPSRISFDFDPHNKCMSVSYLAEKTNDKLDIWALAYLLSKSFNKDEIMNIQIPVDDITTALRLHFLSKSNLFKNISWDVKFVAGLEETVKEITQDVKHNKYITYKQPLSERGTKEHPESLLEKNLCEDLSQLSRDHFDETSMSIRQFPANIFKNEICNDNRITDKFWIDVLSVNKHNQLSVIELKAGKNSPLDLFVQALDYAIYCNLFKSHINMNYWGNIEQINNNRIAIYLVAEEFHPGLIGRGSITGIQSLVQCNDLFDIIFIQIETDGNNSVIASNVLFDTRDHESNYS